MPAVRPAVAPSSQRGFGRAAPLIVLALLALAAGGVIWKLKRSAADSVPAAAAAPTRPASPATVGAPQENEAVDALLTRARGSVAAQHLLAPAGNNAFELYLRVRQREPGNAVAAEALREVFPYAAEQVAATIRDGDPAEAQRQLDLLARADPGNYTLTLLRSQLATRLAAVSHPAPAPAAAPVRDAPAAPAVASEHAPATPPPATPASAVAATPVAPAVVPAAPASTPRPAQPQPQPAPLAEAVIATTAPVLVRRVEPYYPREARRTRREGWVEVAFTVTASGDVANVAVLAADPKIVFDHAATSAVERWLFKPGTRGGKPVAARLKQRLEFRL